MWSTRKGEKKDHARLKFTYCFWQATCIFSILALNLLLLHIIRHVPLNFDRANYFPTSSIFSDHAILCSQIQKIQFENVNLQCILHHLYCIYCQNIFACFWSTLLKCFAIGESIYILTRLPVYVLWSRYFKHTHPKCARICFTLQSSFAKYLLTFNMQKM